MPEQRIHVGALAIEALFIVFGVVLALGANEYRQHLANERRADYVLSTLKAELSANQPGLADVLAYHERALDQIQAARRGDSIRAGNPFPNGIRVARMSRTSWDLAQGTGALMLLPYDLAVVLSNAYEPQRAYETYNQTAMQAVIGALMNADPDERRILFATAPFLTDFIYMERDLLAAHEAALALLADVPMPDGTAGDER